MNLEFEAEVRERYVLYMSYLIDYAWNQANSLRDLALSLSREKKEDFKDPKAAREMLESLAESVLTYEDFMVDMSHLGNGGPLPDGVTDADDPDEIARNMVARDLGIKKFDPSKLSTLEDMNEMLGDKI